MSMPETGKNITLWKRDMRYAPGSESFSLHLSKVQLIPKRRGFEL